jgi:hypothetical protein
VTIGDDSTIRVWSTGSVPSKMLSETVSAQSIAKSQHHFGIQQLVEFWSESDRPTCVCSDDKDNALSSQILICGFSSGFIRIFDIQTASCLFERQFSGNHNPVSNIFYVNQCSLMKSFEEGSSSDFVIVHYYLSGLLQVLRYDRMSTTMNKISHKLTLHFEYQFPMQTSKEPYPIRLLVSSINDQAIRSEYHSTSTEEKKHYILIHEYLGKLTIFDLPNLRILLNSFDIFWSAKPAMTAGSKRSPSQLTKQASIPTPEKLNGASSSSPTNENTLRHSQRILAIQCLPSSLGMFTRDAVPTGLLLIVSERLAKLYSFHVSYYDDRKSEENYYCEIRVQLLSQVSLVRSYILLKPFEIDRVKVLPEVQQIIYFFSSGSKNNIALFAVSKFEITKSKVPSENGGNMLLISKPQLQSLLTSGSLPASIASKNDVAFFVRDAYYSRMRNQLIAATNLGFFLFYRLSSVSLLTRNNNFQNNEKDMEDMQHSVSKYKSMAEIETPKDTADNKLVDLFEDQLKISKVGFEQVRKVSPDLADEFLMNDEVVSAEMHHSILLCEEPENIIDRGVVDLKLSQDAHQETDSANINNQYSNLLDLSGIARDSNLISTTRDAVTTSEQELLWGNNDFVRNPMNSNMQTTEVTSSQLELPKVSQDIDEPGLYLHPIMPIPSETMEINQIEGSQNSNGSCLSTIFSKIVIGNNMF